MAEEYKDDGRNRAEGGAQIYEDKKGGLPWWLWLVLGLLLLGLLFFLLNRNNGTPQAATPPAQTAPAQTAQTTPATTPVAPVDTATTTNGQPVPPGPPSAATDTTAASTTPTKDIKIHSGTDITTVRPAQASDPGVPLSDVAKITAAADPLSFAGQRAKLTNVMVRRVINDRAFFIGPSDSQQMLVLLDKGLDAGTSQAAKVTITTGQPVSLAGIIEKLPTPEALSQTYALSGDNLTALASQKAYLHATVAQEK